MAVVGPKTRSALRKLEACADVQEVRLFHDRVRTTFANGLIETWDLDGTRPSCRRLPRSDWWIRTPIRATEHGLLRAFDDDYEPHADPEFYYSASNLRACGFLDRRVFVNRLAGELAQEGWRRPVTPTSVLMDDLERVRCSSRKHALSSGFIRGQPGRPPNGVPAGLLLCNDLVNWGTIQVPGRPTLSEGWSDSKRLRCAIDALLEEGRPVTRPGLIHRMATGASRGHPTKCAPRWETVSLWISLLRDVIGLDRHPVLLDCAPGCGARGIATAALDGIYLHPATSSLARQDAVWDSHLWPAHLADDGSTCADLAIYPAETSLEFEAAIDELGPRCAMVSSILPSAEREGVRKRVPSARLVRLRSRPFRSEHEVIAVWSQ